MPKKEENEENICHWLECLTQYDTAEDLFNHVCTAHIGRKNAGTLSLECKWTGCRAKASKRDHLTSHCRVHIALKPHVCNICSKAFKRPQDLKKHEKIHTEEHQAQHRINKSTITVSSSDPVHGAHAADPAKAHSAQQQAPPPAQQGFPFTFSAMAGAFPYMFAQPAQAQHAVNPHFTVPSQMELACYIALQQQLNSQAQAASLLPNMSAGLPAALAMQLGQQQAQQAMNAQALQYLPPGTAGVYPYGSSPFGFSAAAPAAAHYSETPTPTRAPASAAPPAPAALTATPRSSIPPPQGQSLYPSLPQSLYGQPGAGYTPHQPQPSVVPQHYAHQHPPPAIKKEEDLPWPAQSARSHKSHYSSSLSPNNVPALSPPSSLTPENYSPSPVPEGDPAHQQRQHVAHASSNTVAGKKRGFEEATGQFLGALANKRFQDAESVGAQLDSLSSFLLTPELTAHALTPPGLGASDSSPSSSGSEYGSNSHVFEREEVDTINQLLLSLNQSFDTDLAASAAGLGDAHGSLGLELHGHGHGHAGAEQHHQQRHTGTLSTSMPSYAAQPASLYPSLPPSLGPRAPAAAAYPQLPTSMASYGYPSGTLQQHQQHDGQLRLSKSVAPPTITNDHRPTQYHHVGRLQRAAPSSTHAQSIEEQVEQELLDADMDVDDEVKDAAAALLMGKSMSRLQLPPPATAMQASQDLELRLAPINAHAGSSSRLPPIRDLLALRSPESDAGVALDSPTSPVASGRSMFPFSSSPGSSASATASSSRAGTAPLYPSLASLAPTSSSRPVSAGGVERLTHRVHKLRLPSVSGDTDHPAPPPVLESEADLSASSDEDDEDHPSSFKKSRVHSPRIEPAELDDEALDEFEQDTEDDEEDQLDDDEEKPALAARAELEARARVAAKRKAVIAYLVMYVNHKYREQLARKSMQHVRKALKKPAAPSSLGAAAASLAVTDEAEHSAAAAAKVEAEHSAAAAAKVEAAA